MRASVAQVVEQFKQSWCRELEDEAIRQAMSETGHVWRDRKLNPVTTVRLFLLQIPYGNVACNFVPRLARKNVTGSGYCEERGIRSWNGSVPRNVRIGCPPRSSRRVRELRYEIARPGFRVRQVTLVTTLLDAQRYAAEQLAKAYNLRWQIETRFGQLKTTLKMDVLRCQTVRGVTKELTMFLLIYNLVRMVMQEAARRLQVSVERISFVDALRWLATAEPGDEPPKLVVMALEVAA